MTVNNAGSSPSAENVGRGTIVALLVVPLGVIAWVIIWNFGIIASIISFGISWGAVKLYRLGSGGLVSRAGAIRIIIITFATVLLAIFSGIVSEVAIALGQANGISAFDALGSSRFWDTLSQALNEPTVLQSLVPSILMAIAFSVLGCYSTLRNTLRASASAASASGAAPRVIDPTDPASKP